jgi:hypothetical protein
MDSNALLRFLGAIDDELAKDAGENETLELHLLGRSALVLGYGLPLMTKDVDIVYIDGSKLQGKAIASFGKGTPGANRYGFYLEAVSSGLPPLPVGYQTRCTDVPGPWKVLRPKWPEPHDLAVSKLKRFHPGDRQGIQILCDITSANNILTNHWAAA